MICTCYTWKPTVQTETITQANNKNKHHSFKTVWLFICMIVLITSSGENQPL